MVITILKCVLVKFKAYRNFKLELKTKKKREKRRERCYNKKQKKGKK
jgi:hypothetical protein